MAIKTIIEMNISYKNSINYCTIKMQIVIILCKTFINLFTFRKHITIFRTLSIDIWQHKCQQIKRKMANSFSVNFTELSNFSSSSFWEKPLWNQNLLLLSATARRFFYTLVRSFPTLSCFPFFHKLFFLTNLRYQNQNNVIETISCFV